MKAAQIDRYGDIGDVVIRDIACPRPERGQVLVKVAFAAVNPLDLLNLTGAVRLVQDYPMPLTLENELAGTVEEVGAGTAADEGCSGEPAFRPGDRVYHVRPLRRSAASARG